MATALAQDEVGQRTGLGGLGKNQEFTSQTITDNFRRYAG